MEKPDQGVLNIISKLVENTDQVWTHLVKPFKHRYSQESLGTPVQVWANTVYEKVEGSFVNSRGSSIVYSYFKNTTATGAEASFTVLYLHSHGGCRVEGYHLMRYLAVHGANLCLFDFAGCGMSGGDYISMGIFERVDTVHMISVLRADHGVQNLVVWGRSMGAATALQAYPDMTGVFCLVLDSPFAKVSNVYSNAVKQRMSIPGFVIGMVFSYANGQIIEHLGFDVEAIRPYKYGAEINIPTVLIGTKEDKITDFEDLLELHRMLPLSEDKKVIMECEGQHNDDRNPIVLKRAIEFAANMLKANRRHKSGVQKATPAPLQFRTPQADLGARIEPRNLRRGRHEAGAFSTDIIYQRQNHSLFEEYKKHYFPEHVKQTAAQTQSFLEAPQPAPQEHRATIQFADHEEHSDMPRREIVKRRTGPDMVNHHRSVNPTLRNERAPEPVSFAKPDLPRDPQAHPQASRKTSPHNGAHKRLGSFGAANFSVGNLHSYHQERPNSPKPSFFQAFPKVGSLGHEFDYKQPQAEATVAEESKADGNQLFSQYYHSIQSRYAKPAEDQAPNLTSAHEVYLPQTHFALHSDSQKHIHQHSQHSQHNANNSSFDSALQDYSHRQQPAPTPQPAQQLATHLPVAGHQPYRPLLGTNSRRPSDLTSQTVGLQRQARSYRNYPEEIAVPGHTLNTGLPETANQADTTMDTQLTTYGNSPLHPPKYAPVPSLLSKQRVSEVAQPSYKPVYPTQANQQYY